MPREMCVCTYLEMVADIDNERAWEGVNEEPIAVGLTNLEAVYLVLEEECEEAVVRMRRHPQRELRLRACGEAVDHHHMRPVV